jgi:ankyrin repeat protein
MGYTCSADILEILLSAGASPSVNDNIPIVNAAALGCAAAVRLLVAAGADPNARDGQPLISAVQWGRRYAV